MNITTFDIYQYSLDLAQPLVLHEHKLEKRAGLIVHLKSASGGEGFGEIAPLPGFSRETLVEAKEQIQVLQANLCGEEIPHSLANLNGQFDEWLGETNLKPSVRFGFESAILNLMASAKNIPLRKLISKEGPTTVKIAGLLSGTKEEVVAQAKKLIAGGFTGMKLKVGPNIEQAIEKVAAVNKVVYGKALLHLDVNQAWTFDEAVAFGKQVGCAAVNYIEEPFKDISKISEFFDETLIPVALDESIERLPFEDIKSISGVDILVLKPTLLGGIEKTWQIITAAENFALDAVISSSFESSLGIMTLANLASTLSHHGVTAGLDTLKWFKTDVLNPPVTIHKGRIDLNDGPLQSNHINFKALHKIENTM